MRAKHRPTIHHKHNFLEFLFYYGYHSFAYSAKQEETSTKDVYISSSSLFFVLVIIKLLLTELSRSVWENLDRSREYRPNTVRSLHTTEVKILPYRPTKLG